MLVNRLHPSFFLLFLLLYSCSANYYQVYNVEPSEKDDVGLSVTQKEDIVFENDSVRLTYKFWGEEHDLKVQVYNKSDEAIFLDWHLSNFIVNDLAYDYPPYKGSQKVDEEMISMNEKTEEQPPERKTPSLGSASNSLIDGKLVQIPPGSFKVIDGFSINRDIINDCDALILPKMDGSSGIDSTSFSKEGSPLRFANRLRYYSDGKKDTTTVRNEFWVSGLYNMKEKLFFGKGSYTVCEDDGSISIERSKFKSNKRFYIKYKHSYPFPYQNDH